MGMQPSWRTKQNKFSLLGIIEIHSHVKKILLFCLRIVYIPTDVEGVYYINRTYLSIFQLSPLGSEWDYVIISLVRSLPKEDIEPQPSMRWLKERLGFLTDEHQINVALTRAKRGLCIIGKGCHC